MTHPDAEDALFEALGWRTLDAYHEVYDPAQAAATTSSSCRVSSPAKSTSPICPLMSGRWTQSKDWDKIKGVEAVFRQDSVE
jgi:hypothetical protein